MDKWMLGWCVILMNTYAHSDQTNTTSHNSRTDGKELDHGVERSVLLIAPPVDQIEDDEGLQEGEEEDEGVARCGGQEGGEEGDCVFFLGGKGGDGEREGNEWWYKCVHRRDCVCVCVCVCV